MIKQYKKKTYYVDAMFYDGGVVSADAIVDWTKNSMTPIICKYEYDQGGVCLILRLLDGSHRKVSPGDYVVRLQGEFKVYDTLDFNTLYEPT